MDHEMRKKMNDFVLYLEQTKDFDKYRLGFNIFSVLKSEKKEKVHSDILAYFLNPNENHNIGDKFLKSFIHEIAQKNEVNMDILEIYNLDYNSFEVFTEIVNNIDIFLINKKDKFIIVIENKIDSDVHDSNYNNKIVSQLEKYKDFVDKEYSDYKKILYLLLSPNGKNTNENGWDSLSYSTILYVFETILKEDISERVKFLMKNYEELLKTRIITDDAVKKLCQGVYDKHREAIEFILQNKDDERKLLGDSFRNLYSTIKRKNDNFIFNNDSNEVIYIFFKTKLLNEYFKDIKSKYGFYVEDNFLCLWYPEDAKENAKKYCDFLKSKSKFEIGKCNKNYVKIIKIAEDDLLTKLEEYIYFILEVEKIEDKKEN